MKAKIHPTYEETVIRCACGNEIRTRATVKDLGGWSTIGVVEKHYTGEVKEVHRRAMQTFAAAQEVA